MSKTNLVSQGHRAGHGPGAELVDYAGNRKTAFQGWGGELLLWSVPQSYENRIVLDRFPVWNHVKQPSSPAKAQDSGFATSARWDRESRRNGCGTSNTSRLKLLVRWMSVFGSSDETLNA